jgi:hypothetical protein
LENAIDVWEGASEYNDSRFAESVALAIFYIEKKIDLLLYSNRHNRPATICICRDFTGCSCEICDQETIEAPFNPQPLLQGPIMLGIDHNHEFDSEMAELGEWLKLHG